MVSLLPFNPWPKNFYLRLLAFLWSLPYGIVGLLVIVLLLISGHFVWIAPNNGGIDVIVQGWYARRKAEQNWAAVTIGWCMFFWEPDDFTDLNKIHERVHIRQALILGILFPIVYYALLFKVGYDKHPFEVQARAVSEALLPQVIDTDLPTEQSQ
jgi:hypothetical protein